MRYTSKITGVATTSCVSIDKWVHLSEPYLFIFKTGDLDDTNSKSLLYRIPLSFWQRTGILFNKCKEKPLNGFPSVSLFLWPRSGSICWKAEKFTPTQLHVRHMAWRNIPMGTSPLSGLSHDMGDHLLAFAAFLPTYSHHSWLKVPLRNAFSLLKSYFKRWSLGFRRTSVGWRPL